MSSACLKIVILVESSKLYPVKHFCRPSRDSRFHCLTISNNANLFEIYPIFFKWCARQCKLLVQFFFLSFFLFFASMCSAHSGCWCLKACPALLLFCVVTPSLSFFNCV